MTNRSPRGLLIWLAAVLALAQLACNAPASLSPTATGPVVPLPTEIAIFYTRTPTPQPFVADQPTATPAPPVAPPPTESAILDAATPTAQSPQGQEPGAPRACLGATSGIACLDDSGWQTFTPDNSALPAGGVSDIQVCPDGRVLAVHSTGVAVYDGQSWKNYTGDGGMLIGASAAACAGPGFWLAYMPGVVHYDGERYTDYPSAEIDPDAGMFRDVAVAPDGAVWAITDSTVSRFDGQAWTTYKEGQGFNESFFFKNVVVDPDGVPWVSHSRGVVYLDGGAWQENSSSKLGALNALAEPQSPGGIWAATSAGLAVLEDGQWQVQNVQADAGTGADVRGVALDGQGRMWAATDYGLAVLDEQGWHSYFMHTAALPDNELTAVSVGGAGPSLPAPQEQPTGSLSATLLDPNGKPMAGARVELCVHSMGDRYFGATPCAGQPFLAKGQTGPDGRFTIPDLPPGYYIITYQHNGRWAQLVGWIGFFSERVKIEQGEDKDIGEVKLQP